MSRASRLTVLMFTDIVGSTSWKTQLGAGAYAQLLLRHNELFESTCASFDGEILKHTGDGFFASFSAASDAVRAALRFQDRMRDESWPTALPVLVRIGIHVGEV